MSKIDLVRDFLKKFPTFQNIDILTDVSNAKINSACLQASGDSVTRISYDVLGNKYREMRCTFILFVNFTTENELMRIRNSLNFENLQNWIYENENLLPPFGNFDQNLEQISAENSVLFNLDSNGESGTYQMQISKNYTVISRKEN